MTRVGIFLIAVALIAGMVSYAAHPIEIRNWYDLNAIRDNLGGSYLLMNDLNSDTAGYEEMASPTSNGGQGWQPIGTDCYNKFTGTFDGRGYEIRDLFINRPDGWGVGLFGWLGEAGVIKNIGIVNITVIGGHGVGGLAGYTSECNECTVSNSYSTGNVTGHSPVGGLISGTWHGPVSNSYSTCSVTGDAFVGGLIGVNACPVSNSYATGSVSGDEHVGGLIGESMGNVSNSYSTGSVSGNEDVGGLVGFNDGTVRNSFWDTETSGQATSDGGIGKTTAEMKNITLFSGAGWNIIAVADPSTHNSSYIWNIVNGMTYPFLSWESVA